MMDEQTKAPLTFDEANKFLIRLLGETSDNWRQDIAIRGAENVSGDWYLQYLKEVSDCMNQLSKLWATIEFWQSVHKDQQV